MRVEKAGEAERRLFGLMAVAEEQQAAVREALDGLAAARTGLAQERAHLGEAVEAVRTEAGWLRTTAGDLGPNLAWRTEVAAKEAVKEELAGAGTMAVKAVEAAAQPLLTQLMWTAHARQPLFAFHANCPPMRSSQPPLPMESRGGINRDHSPQKVQIRKRIEVDDEPGPLCSITTEAARRFDRLKLGEIKLDNCPQSLGRGAVLLIVGQRLQPGAILRLQFREPGDGVVPALDTAPAVPRPADVNDRFAA